MRAPREAQECWALIQGRLWAQLALTWSEYVRRMDAALDAGGVPPWTPALKH